MAQLQAINSLRQADRRVGPGSALSLGRGDDIALWQQHETLQLLPETARDRCLEAFCSRRRV